jgi:hypothetical protein
MAAPKHGDLQIGKHYFGIDCNSCGEFIPLRPNIMGINDGIRGEGTTTIGCPFCGKSDEYPIEFRSQKLEKMPPTAH